MEPLKLPHQTERRNQMSEVKLDLKYVGNTFTTNTTVLKDPKITPPSITVPEWHYELYSPPAKVYTDWEINLEIGTALRKEHKKIQIDKIIRNGTATIVFWADGEKTVVKRSEGETDSLYTAVTAALAKKVYGNNSKFKKMIERQVLVQEKKGKL